VIDCACAADTSDGVKRTAINLLSSHPSIASSLGTTPGSDSVLEVIYDILVVQIGIHLWMLAHGVEPREERNDSRVRG
jgi:hypothetical protein